MNVNYHALFLFIDARELHRHRVSVIKNVFLARLCFLKERHLRGLKSKEKKRKDKEKNKRETKSKNVSDTKDESTKVNYTQWPNCDR